MARVFLCLFLGTISWYKPIFSHPKNGVLVQFGYKYFGISQLMAAENARIYYVYIFYG